jgi:hypothetical protein
VQRDGRRSIRIQERLQPTIDSTRCQRFAATVLGDKAGFDAFDNVDDRPQKIGENMSGFAEGAAPCILGRTVFICWTFVLGNLCWTLVRRSCPFSYERSVTADYLRNLPFSHQYLTVTPGCAAKSVAAWSQFPRLYSSPSAVSKDAT